MHDILAVEDTMFKKAKMFEAVPLSTRLSILNVKRLNNFEKGHCGLNKLRRGHHHEWCGDQET